MATIYDLLATFDWNTEAQKCFKKAAIVELKKIKEDITSKIDSIIEKYESEITDSKPKQDTPKP